MSATPNPIVEAFDAREDRMNVHALRQWWGFTFFWDDSICDATPEEIIEARVVLGAPLSEHHDRQIAI
mgnify:CR=1 FL=1